MPIVCLNFSARSTIVSASVVLLLYYFHDHFRVSLPARAAKILPNQTRNWYYWCVYKHLGSVQLDIQREENDSRTTLPSNNFHTQATMGWVFVDRQIHLTKIYSSRTTGYMSQANAVGITFLLSYHTIKWPKLPRRWDFVGTWFY